MKKVFFAVATALLLAGAGCTAKSDQTASIPVKQNPVETGVIAQPLANNEDLDTDPAGKQDANKNWKTISVGGVITLQIPSNCGGNGAAGSTYITCPTPDNETPTPELVVSSDGIQVNIRRWEGMASPYWNDIVSSLKITTPLANGIQINIDK